MIFLIITICIFFDTFTLKIYFFYFLLKLAFKIMINLNLKNNAYDKKDIF
jgi:hypothetical protein